MIILDLCAGTGSATRAFREDGHEVITVDNDPQHRPDILCDIKQIAKNPDMLGFVPDVIWASPPCQAFSMAGSGSRERGSERWGYGSFRFYGPRMPRDHTARLGCGLVLSVRHIIDVFQPSYWFIENPMGGLKTMGFMQDIQPVIITYCQYGDSRMKPTTLWSNAFDIWTPKPRCKNGDPCHDAAPRGARSGTQGLDGAVLRGMIPYALSREICNAVTAARSKEAAENRLRLLRA